MVNEFSAGCVVFRRRAKSPDILMVADRFGRWSFPKGHIEDGEDALEAALRELKEETGINGRPVQELPLVEYTFRSGKQVIHKKVTYFLVEADPDDQVPQPQKAEGIFKAEFVPLREARSRLGYKNSQPTLEAAIALITAPNSS
jgi:8-oxo-dGTP pyrophosphatase MutT (NUDIX family)